MLSSHDHGDRNRGGPQAAVHGGEGWGPASRAISKPIFGVKYGQIIKSFMTHVSWSTLVNLGELCENQQCDVTTAFHPFLPRNSSPNLRGLTRTSVSGAGPRGRFRASRRRITPGVSGELDRSVTPSWSHRSVVSVSRVVRTQTAMS